MKQHPLSEQFRQYCTAHFPDLPQHKILLAASGGRDSMTLAHLLLKSGLQFGIAHCNYGLRGSDSEEDAALVRRFAEEWQLSFHYIAFNPEEVSGPGKKGLQERARKLRYEWFEELCTAFGYSAVLTAHHANDNAETLLMHLAKGTGIRGLHGIPLRNGRYCRPLLFATRQEITSYAHDKAIRYRDDRSNDSDDYSRNALRHQVIPALEQIFPQTVSAMSQSISHFSGVEKYYRIAIERERSKVLEKRGSDYYILIRRLLQTADVGTLLYELITPFGFSAGQTKEAIKLLQAESGHFLSSETHQLIKDRTFLIITSKVPELADLILIEQANCTIETPEGLFRCRETKEGEQSSDNPNCLFVDAEKVQFPLSLRRRRTGDYFYPSGFGMKKKKISKFLIDKKMSLPDKERIWILANDKQIVWVAGLRADARFLPGKSTKKMLCLEFIPKG